VCHQATGALEGFGPDRIERPAVIPSHQSATSPEWGAYCEAMNAVVLLFYGIAPMR
jgi:hypothetical protein